MLKSLACLFRSVQPSNGGSSKTRLLAAPSISVDFSVQLKDITVRIMHAGGREELYQTEIPASKLMEKYPGMCVARPEVFKYPHESLLLGEEKLLLGHKYYIIPSTTVQKLKRKHSEKRKVKESTEGKELVLYEKIVDDVSGGCSEASIRSAKDFYVSRERWSRCLPTKCQKGKKLFVPPIQKPGIRRGWEPRLPSVQEISPWLLYSIFEGSEFLQCIPVCLSFYAVVLLLFAIAKRKATNAKRKATNEICSNKCLYVLF